MLVYTFNDDASAIATFKIIQVFFTSPPHDAMANAGIAAASQCC